MTMIQYMSDTGLLPGTTHDISMIAAKLGIAGALQDIQNNHPNDMVALIMFSRPNYAGEPAGAGQFSVPRVSLGRDYSSMANALWFPPNSGSADVRLWDTNDQQTPRAHGDYCSNTATDYGLMLAYNQFSSNPSLRASGMGGWGRKGAQKIVILETDGMANAATSAGTTNNGPYQSYYDIGPLGSYSPSGTSAAQSAQDVATRMCAMETDGGSPPGYAQSRKPVMIHCIAFGAIFEPSCLRFRADQRGILLTAVVNHRRNYIPKLSQRPRQRLQMVHRHSRPKAGQAATGVHQDHKRNGLYRARPVGLQSNRRPSVAPLPSLLNGNGKIQCKSTPP